MFRNYARHRSWIGVSVFSFLLSACCFGADLTGTVKDYATGELLEGVTIGLPTFAFEMHTGPRGTFHIAKLTPGRYVLTANLTGYHPYSCEQFITDSSGTYTVEIELKSSEAGENTPGYLEQQPKYKMREITVMTTRASANHPVTFSNLNRTEVEERSYGQDLPLLFTEMPSINAYSDGANGIGYSYLKMRGFTQNRVAVELNGTPLNDAESQEVFWIDLPDFASDVQDIQVQRGVGSSLYGTAAFGGTINVATHTPGLADHPSIRAEGTYGSWNTRRAMIQFESGRVQKSYAVSARLTREETDGYRYGAWARLWSYYLAATHFTSAHTTRLTFYGGPEQTHLAYLGIGKDAQGHWTNPANSSQTVDRRFNPLQYPGEIDNFFQPHYELNDEWKLSGHLNFVNTLYLFRGDGYYDQYEPGTAINHVFFNDTTGGYFDMLKRRNIGETDGGWIPRLTLDHRFGKTAIGGETRLHTAHHEGIVLWGNPLPAADTSPDYHYYNYWHDKQTYSGYVHNLFKFGERVRLLADLQAQNQHFSMRDDQLFNVTFAKNYPSVNPRLGLNYLLLEPEGKTHRPAGTVYGNVSWATREPAFDDIYDPQDYYSMPVTVPERFTNGENGGTYQGPSLKPERLLDVELGTNWQWANARFGLNGYWMSVHDEIVPYGGQLDANGVPVSGNADRTLHQGIELVTAWSPISALDLSGNLTLADHHFIRYSEWDWYAGPNGAFVSRNGNRLAQDPGYLANLRAQYRIGEFTAAVSYRAVGKQYIDNSQNNNTTVSAYNLVNLDFGYSFTHLAGTAKLLELKLRVNNLFNQQFVAFGYDDYDNGEPRYIVGAPRAVYTTLAVEL